MKFGQWCWLALLLACPALAWGQPLVPGTGTKITKVGDDFEDPTWAYNFAPPKSSSENDHQQRLPAGASANHRWFEGVMRGQPDIIRRVPTPEGGIAGSEGSLYLRSKQTGVPGRFSGTDQQDDLIVDVVSRLGTHIPVSWSPSVVVRVYVPPFDQWEQRVGSSLGFRASCSTHAFKAGKGRWGGGGGYQPETYWPGFFIQLAKGNGKTTKDSASLVIRGGPQGGDFNGPRIREPGWITLGMSFTPDGQIHYYAHEGVDDLTEKDHLSSQFPYGYRAESLETFFFNVVSGDNGNWSTAWIIDDPSLYYTKR